jgi:hypothetical protein
MNLDRVCQEVRGHCGSQFDPRVAEAFLQLAAEKGQDYFRDSASTVDGLVAIGDVWFHSTGLRYMKRSMLFSSKLPDDPSLRPARNFDPD